MKRILVPLDGSLAAEQALPTAVALSRIHESTLELLLVAEARAAGGFETWPWAICTARNHGDYIASQADRLSERGSVVDHAMVEGRATDEICRFAVERHVDLIVMVSRGHTGFARILGGSVADAVVRQSRIPVLLLREMPLGRRIPKAALHMDRVLVAIDGSPESFAALDAAAELSDRGVTELHLVEVVTPVLLAPFNAMRRLARLDHDATQHAVDHAVAQLDALAERVAARTGCDVYPHVMIHEDPARAILRTAHGFNASVIAMGTHGRGASRLFMGSVAERVRADGRYPMLIVHPPETATSPDQQLWDLEEERDPSLRSG
jgi:nucleotide-binding universal stress UspA family protein